MIRRLREHVIAPLLAVQVPLELLLLVVLLSCDYYLRAMFDGSLFWGQFNQKTLVEGLYFSVQTVTTVGYGNWQFGLHDTAPEVFFVKRMSIPAMLAGAIFFSLFISGLTNFYAKRA